VQAEKRLGFRDRLLIFSLAFLARAVLMVWAISRVDIFRWSLDTWEYMATMIAMRDGAWDFYMFTYRTPAYPALLRLFSATFGLQPPQMTVWLPLQAVITALGVVIAAHLLYRLTRNKSITLLASLLLAVFPPNLAGETPILSESLFNVSLLIAQLFLLRWVSHQRLWDFMLCILALDTMVLSRATGQYIIVVIVLVILCYRWQLWIYTLPLIVLFSLPIILWTAHNNATYGINTYSTASAYNFLFYKAPSTESMVTGRSPDDLAWDYSHIIEDRIGNPPRTESNAKAFPVGNYDYLYVTDPVRWQAMSELASEKLREFHLLHLVKAPYIIVKQFFSYDTLDRVIPRWLQIILALSTLGFGVIGIWEWIRQRRQLWQHVLVLGMVAYFLISVAMYNPISNIRYLSSFGVYWCLFMALGIHALYRIARKSFIRR
jgi:hypothetical protein